MPSTVVLQRQFMQSKPPVNGGLAGTILANLSDYSFDYSSIRHYDEQIQSEVREAIRDLRGNALLRRTRGRLILPTMFNEKRAIASDNPIERDQAVWGLVQSASESNIPIKLLIRSIETAPSQELAVSALLALGHVARLDLQRALAFLHDIASRSNSEKNLAEWARLIHNELSAVENDDLSLMDTPVSDRPVVHHKGLRFDVTLPLIFQCTARTRVGGVNHEIKISPTWFKQIFGDAMACVNADDFESALVLEKKVMGLHEDGTDHFEHFPFTGTTTRLSNALHYHNYWSQLHRPFYTSGRVEIVTEDRPVIQRVPMTFCRLAMTAAYPRYQVDGVNLPESVRGVFFGYGHIEPMTLIKRGLNIRAGDFQISCKLNPGTGKPANTQFWGTFFGKLTDTDSEGRLVMNGRPVHCDRKGHLDYYGDGAMVPDPVRPQDWE